MSTPNVSQLFQKAAQEGTLSPASAHVLAIPDLGAQIQAGLGVSVDDVTASEVMLIGMMPDDSGSMSPNTDAVCDGHNVVLDAFKGSKQKDGILVHCRYLNGNVLYPFAAIDQAVRMSRRNYSADQGTPLYDQAVVFLGTMLAKAQEFADAGVPVRAGALIMTDGQDLHSVRSTARDVERIVKDMLKQETYIVAAMGFDNGSTDFRSVFSGMGIRDEWILTVANSPSEIRKAFRLFSQSMVRASQGAGAFSKTALGGFATP